MRKMHSDLLFCWLLGLRLACLGYVAQPCLLHASADAAQSAVWPHLPAFIDDVVTTQLLLYNIPGAVVALVSDDGDLYLSGYGYADRETNLPVRANKTLFGTGSISKLFTYTAVMQLVEQGKLALDRDINHYLTEFQIPANYPQPITLAHLMTHTAGFEDRLFGFHARSADELLPLNRFLGRYLPTRVFPPGEVSAYSNYGAALAGHIVEQVAGTPFDHYVELHVFAPLGMTRSSFRQPLPPALAPTLATGYRGSNGLSGREWYQAAPAGALKATAADMARFLRAHLQGGGAGMARILKPSSLAMMHRQQFTNHPAVSGLGYGFQELRRGARRILWHPGDTLFFTAGLFLLPDLKLGLYVAYNRGGLPSSPPLELLDAILERVAPQQLISARRGTDADTRRTARLTGSYRSTRSGFGSLEKLLKLFSAVRVRDDAPGVLHISGLDVVAESHWVEQSPYVFRDAASEEIIAFREPQDKRPTYLFEGNQPVAGYFRLPWYGAAEVHRVLLALCCLVFLSTVITWPVQAWRFRHRAAPDRPPSKVARRLAFALCLINLAFMFGMLVVLSHPHQLLFGIPPMVRALLLLPLLSAVLTMIAAASLVAVWKNEANSLPVRMHYTTVVMATVAFLWSLHYWQLL